jgi:HSP20 family protein
MHDLGMSSSLLNMGFPDPFDFPFGRYRQNMPTVRKFREDLATSGAMPAINLDVSETKTDWHIKADIPGMKKEDIKVTFDDGTLEISAERKYSRQSEDANKDSKADTAKEEDYHKFHFSEITYGKVYRSLKFPPTADAQKLDAKYENGVLHITLGKKNVDEKTKKVIEIK